MSDNQNENNPLVEPNQIVVEEKQAPLPPEEDYLGHERPALTIIIQSWATPILALVMLVLGLVVGFVGRPLVESQLAPSPTAAVQAEAPAAGDTAAQRDQIMADFIAQTVHFMGDDNAPITIIEFSDFQCPYCGLFAKNTQQALIDQYVSTGKVRFGYSHFAFLGQESLDAASASECAGDQNKFWEYHDALFASQNGENQGAFKQENLIALASQLKLDKESFTTCLTSGKYLSRIQSQTQFAGSNGLSSTPSFLVNGYLIKGAQEISAFKQVIDSLLKE